MILSIVIVLGVTPFVSAAKTYKNLTYEYSSASDSITITDCNSTVKGELVIPNHIDGKPVTSIGFRAFQNCTGLTSITIPSSVTSIGRYAFSGCTGLTSIIIPSSVTSIGDYAFYGCTGLTSITIPGSVDMIGDCAFYDCTGLTSITILGSVDRIGDSAFYGCEGLKNVTISEGVTRIGDSAFSGCSGLTSITILKGVTSIGSQAFYGCSGLTSIIIPSSVTSIGWSAFSGCSGLTSITVDKNNSAYHSSGNCLIKTATKELINGCNTSVIPDDGSVTSIGWSAFSGCSGLTSITVDKNNSAYHSSGNCLIKTATKELIMVATQVLYPMTEV